MNRYYENQRASTISPRTHHNHNRPNTYGKRRQNSSSPTTSEHCYATPSICSSPSARVIPMPPAEWFTETSSEESTRKVSTKKQVTYQQQQQPTMQKKSSSSSLASSSSSSTSSSMSTSSNYASHGQHQGLRVTPLQLIAAVASS